VIKEFNQKLFLVNLSLRIREVIRENFAFFNAKEINEILANYCLLKLLVCDTSEQTKKLK